MTESDKDKPDKGYYVDQYGLIRYVGDRPTLPIPDDFDVETEQRRAKQGGCCH